MTQAVAESCIAPIEAWFAQRGWQPLPFQQQTWRYYLDGHSGLVQVPTGSGKTYAAFLGPLAELHAQPAKGLQILYLSPLRAMTRDIEQALLLPIQELGWDIKVAARTGDTSGHLKKKQLQKLPQVLVTTPESLSVMLSYKDSGKLFANLRAVIVDEWHELMSSKRGTQTELCLARLRSLAPTVRTWALSATIANMEEAAQTVVGRDNPYQLVRAKLDREVVIESVLPEDIDSFPWAGHLGLKLLPQLVQMLDAETSTLIFTNTRSQAERWFQALCLIRPHWEPCMALHHGSIDKASRQSIEQGLKSGSIKIAICTSSLDLGVDFAPVESVVQIGSAKGIARLVQRAGRSGHRPGEVAKVIFVPTHALELVEISAIRQALKQGAIESRHPLEHPFDVLGQHLVTCAAGDGFDIETMYHEVTTAYSYRNLTTEAFAWVLAFVEHGGSTLTAYPQYHKVVRHGQRMEIANDRMAKMHRLSIGTITSDTAVKIMYQTGGQLGTIEEYFVARLKPGDVFVFAGRQLELVRMRGMTAYVKRAQKKAQLTPAWIGGQLPITPSLSHHLRERFAVDNSSLDAEMKTLAPIVQTQRELSRLPDNQTLLVEHLNSREGQHLFVYPFEGRLVHEGLAALLCYRLAQKQAATFTFSVNDYGLEILATKDYPIGDLFERQLLSPEQLREDIHAALNLSELAKRQFRGIAQVAGLVFQGYPGSRKTGRQLQTSAALLYDVFRNHDPDNLLLKQAEREVLTQQLESKRLRDLLDRLKDLEMPVHVLARPTPLAFPLMIERLSARLSNESLLTRIERMKAFWQKKS